ncbi:MAG: ATP-grasp domain-containing protein [Bacteroidia bacterium]|nr:ATP-grasp domain-containing protein [Bacteroidia bacterium]
MKRILVTGIGGNVGQGIVRNVRGIQGHEFFIVGTNSEFVSAGNYLCDKVYEVPYAYDENYIPRMIEICKAENIDLILPSTDYETYYLGSNKASLPAVACADGHISHIFLDKYRTYTHFSQHDIPFAESVLPSEYQGQFSQYIVKPREGRGSRNLFFNPENIQSFKDDYVVQNLYKGVEITTAFYVLKNGENIGHITFERELSSGATSKCEVTFAHDEWAEATIQKMIKAFNLTGPCNIQSIVTETGEIYPFEINGRFSGTNSIRSQFGFEDIRYAVEEHLLGITPQKPVIRKGSAMRILLDVIFPDTPLSEIKDKNTPHYLY